ncbi:hypothetical protein PFISCL1PPCAC_6990 [Pristionchus fissidentatus]|uniref:Ribosomal protein n=1 Tax=Pristionchus fissidentatus TaxID=1538716 RepID=A0AAV5V900_9BILA|nr:hypothetical protein PFISCL1PPCAC_6990 [Pristionchus fissidentatus]
MVRWWWEVVMVEDASIPSPGLHVGVGLVEQSRPFLLLLCSHSSRVLCHRGEECIGHFIEFGHGDAVVGEDLLELAERRSELLLVRRGRWQSEEVLQLLLSLHLELLRLWDRIGIDVLGIVVGGDGGIAGEQPLVVFSCRVSRQFVRLAVLLEQLRVDHF